MSSRAKEFKMVFADYKHDYKFTDSRPENEIQTTRNLFRPKSNNILALKIIAVEMRQKAAQIFFYYFLFRVGAQKLG